MDMITTTKNGTRIELNEGRNDQDQTVYIVTTERTGVNGQMIKHTETFASRKKALKWIDYGVLN